METKELFLMCRASYLISDLMGIRIRMVDSVVNRIRDNRPYPKYLVFSGGKIYFSEVNGEKSEPMFSEKESEMSEDYYKSYSELVERVDEMSSGKVKIGDIYTDLPNVVSFVDGPESVISIVDTYYDLHTSSNKEYERLSKEISSTDWKDIILPILHML